MSLKKARRLKRWATKGYFGITFLVHDAFQEKRHRGRVNSLIQAGIIDNKDLKILLNSEIINKNSIGLSSDTILLQWQRDIDVKGLGHHTGLSLFREEQMKSDDII